MHKIELKTPRSVAMIGKTLRSTEVKTIRIGTRGSRLALVQAEQVCSAIKRKFPELICETVIIRTLGDQVKDKQLYEFGGQGVFISELEQALISGEIDIACHSAKDMPMQLADGMQILATLSREDAREVLVTRKGLLQYEGDTCRWGMDHPRIGTGSLRRQAHLMALMPEVVCTGLRGNVPTRLAKVTDGELDGVLLAAAGLKRLGLLEEPELDYHIFSIDEIMPAGGQGIIAMEGRPDTPVQELLECLNDGNAYAALMAERRTLKRLGLGCNAPVGVYGDIDGQGRLRLRLSADIQGTLCRLEEQGEISGCEELADRLAERYIRYRDLPRDI